MGKTTTISRRELYQQVWAEPITVLSRRYGLSDVGLAKICKRNNIPRPGLGYWAQRRAGKKVQSKPLPQYEKNWNIQITQSDANKNNSEQKYSPFKLEPQEKHFLKQVIVPDVLTNPHPLVRESLKTLKSCDTDSCDLTIPAKGNCLDIRVSRASLDRTLRIVDSLFKALEHIGVDVRISGKSTDVVIKGVSLSITLREMTARRHLKAQDHDLECSYYRFGFNEYYNRSFPAGILCLEISNTGRYSYRIDRKKWKDTETKRLEDWIYSFTRGLFRTAAIKNEDLDEKERLPWERTDRPQG